MKLLARTSIAAAALLISGVAAAGTIAGLVNTGAGLAAGSTDTHYTYSVSGGDYTGLSGSGVVSNSNVDPFPSWLANTASSSWLIPTADQSINYSSSESSTFTWSLNFDLTGYDLSSASITGRWASDNSGVLLLNGTVISTILGNGYNTWTNFSGINSALTTGKNTLSFVVTDDASATYNYTGLRVEFASATANLGTPLVTPAVPEPESYAMMLAGLAALGFLARRRRD
ncbi:PEP-CTERM sorting domain-containing protein [Roseateles amylovorans]|uniref:PEP-CTERM sorting domain-containing protein n=1 Tax=Roseateles amylovorans TaxID=2978473 RepID=A0ABY6B4P2_9BURK|nr:PEP-CTERM sorting domain-containing protein [Roseateles amylovorans]UXH78513.1 PEP-CTERM sorting domain-containing protein [Roseateles amylovorans]